MSDINLKMDDESLLNMTPRRSTMPSTHLDISNSTTKKFSNVVAQYMRVHKISSLNPAVVTQAADHTGLQGDSYHQWDQYNPPTPTAHSRTYEPLHASSENLLVMNTPSLDAAQYDNWSVGGSQSKSNTRRNNEILEMNTPSLDAAQYDNWSVGGSQSKPNTNRNKPLEMNTPSLDGAWYDNWSVGGSQSKPSTRRTNESLEMNTPSLDTTQYDNWSVGGSQSKPNASRNKPLEMITPSLDAARYNNWSAGGSQSKPNANRNKPLEMNTPSLDAARYDNWSVGGGQSKPYARTTNESLEMNTPTLDAAQYDNWSVGGCQSKPNASTTNNLRDSNEGITESTPTSYIAGSSEITPTVFNAGTTESTPSAITKEKNLNMECSSIKTPDTAGAACNQREPHPSFPFLPANHHLQLPNAASNKSCTPMNSFWNDYERTAYGSENYGDAHTPLRYLNCSGSQNQTTPGSVFSNSAFESQIDTVMEPDSLEKKPITPAELVADLSSNNSRNSFAHSSTVASCLPHLLMSEYTESPPYMPSESFNYAVMDNGGTHQRMDVNNNSDFSSGRLRTSQTNIEQSTERSSNSRNSFTDYAQNASVTRNEASSQPIAAASPCLVLDSLADEIEEKKKNRQWMVIGIFLMFIGALIHIIGLAILVYAQNKKFAPYNGIYPNGCRDVILIEGAMHSHGVNCTQYLAQQEQDKGIVM